METTTIALIVAAAVVVVAVVIALIRGGGGAKKLENLSPDRLGEIAREGARAYQQQHKQNIGHELDYTREGLKHIDAVLEKNFDQNTLSEKQIEQMGLYLGEVIRRSFGGEWRYNAGFDELCLEVKEEGFIFPISQIKRALEHKESGQISSYVDSIAERQAAAVGGGR